MDEDRTAAMQPDPTDARARDEAALGDAEVIGRDGSSTEAAEDRAQLDSERPLADLVEVEVEAEADAKARALADWVARVQEHAPSLLSAQPPSVSEPPNVSVPPVVRQPGSVYDREAQSAAHPERRSASADATVPGTAQQLQPATPEEVDEVQPPSAAPPRTPAGTQLAAAVADESRQPPDITYTSSLLSRVSLPSDQDQLREPAGDTGLRATGSGQADTAPRAAFADPAEAGLRADRRTRDAPREPAFTLRSPPPVATGAPVSRGPSMPREIASNRTRIEERDRRAYARQQARANFAAFQLPAAAGPKTAGFSPDLHADDDFAPSAAFPPQMIDDAPLRERSTTSEAAWPADVPQGQSVVRDERPLALVATLWPSLPESAAASDDADDVTTTLRVRDRWARLVREQEST